MEEPPIDPQTLLAVDDAPVVDRALPKRGRKKKSAESNDATGGIKASLGTAADKLRSKMDAAEYKHITLGLLFFMYISDTFEERRARPTRPSRSSRSYGRTGTDHPPLSSGANCPTADRRRAWREVAGPPPPLPRSRRRSQPSRTPATRHRPRASLLDHGAASLLAFF